MRTGTVVIGANYGDEGKGLITDYEVRRHKAHLVARFNGGAQAGHTVVDRDKRHVFGHVSAGTFAGACTYLSSRFLVNPILLDRELTALKKIGFEPIISANHAARVSTIYDMALNSIAEIARGSQRHGSCGVGINETVTRHAAGFELTLVDLLDGARTRQIIERIQNEWVPKRLQELTGNNAVPIAEMLPYFDALKMPAWRVTDLLREHVHGAALEPQVPLAENAHVVFEGAQGLMLDEFMGDFPHVTRSMTGLPYAIEAAGELGVRELQPVYVTRSYLTRHGAGPLGDEGKLTFKVNDDTNVLNPWQGQLRFAPLDLTRLEFFVKQDFARSKVVAQMHGVKLKEPRLAITWLDVKSDTVPVVVDCFNSLNPTTIMDIPTEELPSFIEEEILMKVSHIARGPEHTDVEYVGPA